MTTRLEMELLHIRLQDAMAVAWRNIEWNRREMAKLLLQVRAHEREIRKWQGVWDEMSAQVPSVEAALERMERKDD